MLLDLGVETSKLHVATTLSTLTNHTLRGGVNRRQLDAVVLAAGVLLLELAQHLLERNELANKDIGLVDLVSNNDKVVISSNINDITNVLLTKNGTSGVTGVDDNNRLEINVLELGSVNNASDLINVSGPALLFIKMVLHSGRVDKSQGSRVEGVLGNGDKETGRRTGGKSGEELSDTNGGTGAEVDSLGIRGETITLLNKLGNRLSDSRNTLGMRVSADGSNFINKKLGTLNRVLLEEEFRIGVLKKVGVLNQSQDLSVKGDGVLVKLLGVANVGVDDLLKGKGTGVSLKRGGRVCRGRRTWP